MNYLENFLIIDDDKINNKLCRKIIEKTYPSSEIVDFTDPVEGFRYLENTFSAPDTSNGAILLLDISMPVLNAWDFLEQFHTLDEIVKQRVCIYILSSSVDVRDMERANANQYVEYYLIKPLTRESIKLMVYALAKKKK